MTSSKRPPIDKREKKRRLAFISKMRQAFVVSETYTQAIESALSENKGPRGGNLYVCGICEEDFSKGKVELDHFPDPLTPYEIFQYEMSQQMVIDRLFCDPSNLRVLCKTCHSDWTRGEQKKLRNLVKKEIKANARKENSSD